MPPSAAVPVPCDDVARVSIASRTASTTSATSTRDFAAHVSSTNSDILGSLSAFIVSVQRSICDVGPVGWSFLLRSVPVSSLCCSSKTSIVSGSASCAPAIPLLYRETLSVSNLLWCEISDVLQIVVNNQFVKSGGFSCRPSRSPERQHGLNIVQTPGETDHRVGTAQ